MSITAIDNTFASLLTRSLFNFYDSKLAVGYLQFISWQERHYSWNDLSQILMFPLSKDKRSSLYFFKSIFSLVSNNISCNYIQNTSEKLSLYQGPVPLFQVWHMWRITGRCSIRLDIKNILELVLFEHRPIKHTTLRYSSHMSRVLLQPLRLILR